MEDKENKLVVEEHNASFDDDPVVDVNDLSEDELQDTILADSDMNAFQRFIAKMDDKKWKLTQRVMGVVLGLGSGAALFGENLMGTANAEQFGSWSLIIAVVIALLVPNLIEKQSGRKITVARMTMAITLLVVLVAYFIYAGVRSDFKFTN